MNARLLLCLALLGVVAFAPAPFPRTGRRGSDVAIEQIQGTWTILKLEMTDGKGGLTDQGNYLKEVRIDRDRWSFFYRDSNNKPVIYRLGIDTSQAPAALDLTRPGAPKPYGTGIISRRGNSMRVLYSFGMKRPTSFDKQPSGYWQLTLQFAR